MGCYLMINREQSLYLHLKAVTEVLAALMETEDWKSSTLAAAQELLQEIEQEQMMINIRKAGF